MCRISGLIGYNPELIDRMLVHQHAGGPDHSGWQFCDEEKRVVFGHNRLSIIDLSSAGHQPMESARYVLTYNGEIYNYRDLQASLSPEDDLRNGAAGGNDARTLLLYIEKYGINAALRAANGMFAFALYDKWEHVLRLAVDRFGQKPLYFVHEGDKLAFASTPAALMVLKDKWTISPSGLLSYFSLGACTRGSVIGGIGRVYAGEMVSFNTQTGDIELDNWYEPHAEQFDGNIFDIVRDAIDEIKVSDVPVSIFLSGGVDSTLVASRFGPGTTAIHLNSPEVGYAKTAADRFGLNLEVVSADFSLHEAHKDYCLQTGEPSAAAHIPWIVCKRVAELGFKVAITANGADELFFGYPRTSDRRSRKQEDHIFRKRLGEPFHEFYTTLCARQYELETYVQHDLCRTLDFAAACHGIEVRAPFLDHNLVEAALSLPETTHRFDGDKTILKAMLSNLGFPRSFTHRPKLGFSLHGQEPDEAPLRWVLENGYLYLPDGIGGLSPRDYRYLTNAAYAFRVWLEVWEHKLDLRK